MESEKENPLVSVCMVTYNHEKYISQALDSILKQKVDFKYEIVVGDDGSADNTRKILLDYYEKYPGYIRLLLQKKNVGIGQNVFDTLFACKGKYIAVLDGDDFWKDEYKLKKQIEFLEKHQETGMVHSRADIVNETGELLFVSDIKQPSGDVFDHLLFRSSFILTCTICFRRNLIDSLLEKMKINNTKYLLIDYYIWLYVALNSEIQFFEDILSASRSHQSGITKSGDDFYKHRIPYILIDVINERFLISHTKKISFKKKLKYGMVYSDAILSSGMNTRDKIRFSVFFVKRFYLMPAIFLSFLIKLLLYTKRIIQFKAAF